LGFAVMTGFFAEEACFPATKVSCPSLFYASSASRSTPLACPAQHPSKLALKCFNLPLVARPCPRAYYLVAVAALVVFFVFTLPEIKRIPFRREDERRWIGLRQE
jgi:hypothetical protein